MPYTNEAQLVYIAGLDTIPEVTARLWMLWTTFDSSNRFRTHQAEFEDDVVRSGARFAFAFDHGPSLFEEVRTDIGLTLHESQPAMDGPLFRSGRFPTLPTPFPDDPEGFVDIVAGSPVVIQVGPALAASTRTLRDPPMRGDGWTLTSVGLAAPSGAITVTATGTTSTSDPFAYTRSFTLQPSWDVISTATVLDLVAIGTPTATGPVPTEVRGLVNRAVADLFDTIKQIIEIAAVRELGSLISPPPAPGTIGPVPPTVTLSVRRIRIGGGRVLALPALASFGDLTAKLFPVRASTEPPPPVLRVTYEAGGVTSGTLLVGPGLPLLDPAFSINLGAVPVGTGSFATVLCQNVTETSVRFQSVTLGGDFRNVAGAQPANTRLERSADVAEARETVLIALIFTPTEPGPHTGSLTVTTSRLLGDPPPFTIGLLATAIGVKLEVSPADTLDFGVVQVGATANRTVTVHNTGNADVTFVDLLLQAESPAGQFLVPFTIPDRSVKAGEARTFNVAYSPTAAGMAEAALELLGTDAFGHEERHVVALSGNAVAPAVALSPNGLSFPTQVVRTVSGPQTVTLSNVGAAPLSITGISSDTADFSVTQQCAGTLPVGASCPIQVAFRPTTGGNRVGALVVASNAPGSPHTVPLAGIGLLQPIAVLAPTTLSFGSQPVGAGGPAQAVTLTNDGAADLHVAGVAVAGPHAADFAVVADGCTGGTLQPEQACSTSAQFRPGGTGSRTARLEFTDDAAGSPHVVLLDGTGVPAPAVAFDPTVLEFGGQPLQSPGAARTATLTNNGPAPLELRRVEVGGADASDFRAGGGTCAGATLAPGTSCSINLEFRPLGVGDRQADLIVEDATGAQHSLPLRGVGVGPAVTFDPPSLSFPPQPIGTFSQRQDVLLNNSGNAPLTISGISVDGDFRFDTSCGPTVPAGGFCRIRLICSPLATGPRSGQITVVDDAPGSPHAVPLAGEGVAPVATVSPPTLDLGAQAVGSSGGQQAITLSNTGSGPLIVTGASLGGVNAGDFQVAADTCSGSVIPPGAACSIDVRFSPQATGPRSAELVISHNAPSNPSRVGLSGKGT